MPSPRWGFEMTLGYFLRVLRKRWRIVAAMTVIGIVAAGILSLAAPKIYSANASNFVSIAASDSGESNALYQNSQFAMTRVESYPEVAMSPDVLQPVIDDLGLDLTVAELREQLTVVNPPSTVLIDVTAKNEDPEVAADVANSVSENLAKMIETLEQPRAGGTSPVKVSNAVPAGVPRAPTSPKTMMNLALGLVCGLTLGIFGAILRERFDTTIKTTEDLRALTGAAPLGVIRNDPTFKQNSLIALTQQGATVEDLRSVRTNLKFIDVDAPPRQLVISSAIAGEGKSVLTSNLAITLAHSQLRVCLVEADLRRPRATKYLGIEPGIGLSDVVVGQYTLDQALVEWHRGLLTVLPAGDAPPDPTHLLGSQATAQVLRELRSRFDLVLIDAPPLLPVSDAAILGALSDGVILIANFGRVRRDQIDLAANSLGSVGAQLVGTILNRAPMEQREAQYGPEYDIEPPHIPKHGLTSA